MFVLKSFIYLFCLNNIEYDLACNTSLTYLSRRFLVHQGKQTLQLSPSTLTLSRGSS